MEKQALRLYLQFMQNTLVRVTARNPLAFAVNECEDIHAFRRRLLDLQIDLVADIQPLLDPGREHPAALRSLRAQLRALRTAFRFDPDGQPSRPAMAVEERGKKDDRPRRSPPPGIGPLRRRPVGVAHARPLPPRPPRSRRRLPLPLRRPPGGAHPARRRAPPLPKNRPHRPARPSRRLPPPPALPPPPPRPRQPL